MAITPDRTRKYREALRNIMSIISEEFGETFPGDEPWLDAIIQQYVNLGWFDQDTNELPAYRGENPELEPAGAPVRSIAFIGPAINITEAGWYRTANGSRAQIEGQQIGYWYGMCEGIDHAWRSNGTSLVDDPSMHIVSKVKFGDTSVIDELGL